MSDEVKIPKFDPEASHAAMFAEDEAVVIETNVRGGKQSKIKGKMTEVPPLALIEVSSVMGLGAENYPRESDGTPNWHKITCAENIDHAMEHVANYLAERNKGDYIDDGSMLYCREAFTNNSILREELSHAAARMLMALEQFIREEV